MSAQKSTFTTAPKGQNLHQATSTPIFILSVILLVVLIVSFVFAPALGSAHQGLGNSLVFGRYGHKEIAYRPDNYFAQQIDNLSKNARAQGWDPSIPFLSFQIWKQAFYMASQRAILLEEAERAHIDIGENNVMDALKESGYFSRGGTFNAAEFNNTSPARRQSLLNNIQEQLMIQEYEQMLAQNVHRSKEAVKFLTRPATELRKFKMAVFPFDQYPAQNVRQFATENIKLFQQINVQRILVQGKKQDAIKVYATLTNGEKDFSTVFTESSREEFANEDFSARQGKLENYFYHQLQDSLIAAEDVDTIFALGQDQFAPPVRYKTEDKNEVYAIYQVTKPVFTLDMSEDDAIKTVRSYIINARKNLISDYYIELAKNIDATQFARTIGRPGRFVQTGDFGLVYHLSPESMQSYYHPYADRVEQFSAAFGKDNQTLSSQALASKEFFVQAFKLKPNDLSAPIILNDAVVVLQLVHTTAPAEGDVTSSEALPVLSYIEQSAVAVTLDQALKSKRYKDKFEKTYAKSIEPYMQQQQEMQAKEQAETNPQAAEPEPSDLHLPETHTANEGRP